MLAYKMDRAWLEEQRDEALVETGRDQPAALAIGVASLASNLWKHPERYLRYGPYWFAIKQALRDGGEDFGPHTDAFMVKEYGMWDGDQLNPYLTMLAAEAFKDYYSNTFFEGTRDFELDPDGDAYVLEDEDMEAR